MFKIKPNSKISVGVKAKWQSTVSKLQYLDFNDYSVYTGTSGIALLKLKKDPNNIENLQVTNCITLYFTPMIFT